MFQLCHLYLGPLLHCLRRIISDTNALTEIRLPPSLNTVEKSLPGVVSPLRSRMGGLSRCSKFTRAIVGLLWVLRASITTNVMPRGEEKGL